MKQVNLKNLCMILLGNTVYALAIVMFILPNDMITGGTTGLGIAIHHYFGLPIHTFVLIFNTLMFLLGAAVLGMKFALTTLVSTFYYPVILGVLEQIPALQNVTDDKMLSTICGGLMIGMGIGIVIRCGASTGGMDIPPLVLNKKFGLPVSVMLYVFYNPDLTDAFHQQRRDCIRYLTGTDLYRHSGQGTADGIYQNKSRDHD